MHTPIMCICNIILFLGKQQLGRLKYIWHDKNEKKKNTLKVMHVILLLFFLDIILQDYMNLIIL